MITRRLFGLGAAALAAASRPGQAQDGPVTLMVPFTPGTGMDILARLAAPVLQQRLGQPVVVENRPGASGNIGTQAVARAAPDGRTLLVSANTFVTNVPLFQPAPYDAVAQFTPVILLTDGDLVLVVNPDVPARTVAEFTALAKQRPLDYASPGIGTPQHLAMELFRLEAKVELNHVPYRGSAPAVQDVLGRRVAAMVMPVHTALPLAAEGRVRMLAVGSPRRVPSAPDVPSFAEAGFPGVEIGLWYPLLGPAGLPQAMVQRLNAALNEWLALPATQAQLRQQGMVPVGGTPEVLAGRIARDLARWTRVVRDANIRAE